MAGRRSQRADGPPRYRAYPPFGLLVPVAVVLVVPLMLPPLLWLDRAGVPSWLTNSLAGALMGLVVGLPARKVTLPDGRLVITGIGRRVDVDVRRITAIRVTGVARTGFAGAEFVWESGRFRVWTSMRRLPDHRAWYRRGRGERVSEDFRDLVYRLYLANPAMTIEGVIPRPTRCHPRHPSIGDRIHR